MEMILAGRWSHRSQGSLSFLPCSLCRRYSCSGFFLVLLSTPTLGILETITFAGSLKNVAPVGEPIEGCAGQNRALSSQSDLFWWRGWFGTGFGAANGPAPRKSNPRISPRVIPGYRSASREWRVEPWPRLRIGKGGSAFGIKKK